jgi:hypothetical protein
MTGEGQKESAAAAAEEEGEGQKELAAAVAAEGEEGGTEAWKCSLISSGRCS